MPDLSNGYDAESANFIAGRSLTIGVSIIRSWAQSLAIGTSVLDVGCGNGIPITQILLNEGLRVHAIDASPKMVSAFRQNFPKTPVVCQAIEQIQVINHRFDAAIAWGLIFLLTPEKQATAIQNISKLLNHSGRFLFTSPQEVVTWRDIRTGRESVSLGALRYQSLLSSSGLSLVAEYNDEGSNHYFEAQKSS